MTRLHTLHPATLFGGFTIGLVLLTWLAEAYGLQVTDPQSLQPVCLQSIIHAEGIRWLLRHLTDHFILHPAFGHALLALFAWGTLMHSHLLNALLRLSALRPFSARTLLLLLVVSGVLVPLCSSEVAFLFLPPWVICLFRQRQLPPQVGLFTVILAISCGFTHFSLFMAVTTPLILPLLLWHSCRLLQRESSVRQRKPSPLLTGHPLPSEYPFHPSAKQPPLSYRERRALVFSLVGGAIYLLLILWASYPVGGILRSVDGGLLHSPLMEGLVSLISIGLALMSGIYGWVSGRYRHDSQLIEGFSELLFQLRDYLLILFVAAQMSAIYHYSHLDTYLLIQTQQLLSALLSPLALPNGALEALVALIQQPITLLSPFFIYMPLIMVYLRWIQPTATYFTLWHYSWLPLLLIGLFRVLLWMAWWQFGWPFTL